MLDSKSDFTVLCICGVCFSAIGAFGDCVNAFFAFCLADVAQVLDGGVTFSTQLAFRLVPASVLQMSEPLTLTALCIDGSGIDLLYPGTDASNVDSVSDAEAGLFLGREGDHNRSCLLRLTLFRRGEPVGVPNYLESVVVECNLRWHTAKVGINWYPMDGHFEPGLI